MRGIILTLCGTLLCGSVWADSILIEGERHEGVYIDESPRMYYVRFPETGEIVNVAKGTVAPADVRIDDDETQRARLLAAWKAHQPDAAPEDTSTPDVAASPELDQESPAPDFDTFAFHKQIASIANFEAALLHWQSVPQATRQGILQSLGMSIEAVAVENAVTIDSLKAQQQAFREAARSNTEAVGNYVERQQTAYERAYEAHPNLDWHRYMRDSTFDRSHFYRSLGLDGLADYTWDSGRYYAYKVRRDYAEADAHANAEIGRYEVQKRAQIEAYKANQAAAEFLERNAYRRGQQLGTIQMNLSREAGFVAGLSQAMQEDYENVLTYPPVEAWENHVGKTPAFRIAAPVWRIDWWVEGVLGQEGDMDFTVYSTDDDRAVAHGSTKRAPYLFFEILDGPGAYYLDIDQKRGTRSFVTVSEVRY